MIATGQLQRPQASPRPQPDQPATGRAQWVAVLRFHSVLPAPLYVPFEYRKAAVQWCIDRLREIDPWYFQLKHTPKDPDAILAEYADVCLAEDEIAVYPLTAAEDVPTPVCEA